MKRAILLAHYDRDGIIDPYVIAAAEEYRRFADKLVLVRKVERETPGSVGDKFAFGSTEERARLANMGCKQRGFRGQRAFDHTTGQGYVKSQRGHYHDGIFTKRNKFILLLHETFGGGFSPPAVAKINRLARKAQRSGVDRTAYPPHSRLSFVSHHAERISIASVKGVNRAILDRRAKLASELSRRA